MARPALDAFRRQNPPGQSSFHDPGEQPDLRSEEDFVGYCQRRHDDWYNLRSPYDPTWFMAMAHYLGLHWHRWYEAERQIRQSPAPAHRVRMVLNRIMPTIKTLIGKMLRGQRRFICSPTDTTDLARSETRVAQRLTTALWKHCHMFGVEVDVLLWALITGTGFFKVAWDPALGDTFEDPMGNVMQTGDIDVQAVGPLSIYVPSWLRTFDRPAEVIHASVEPVEHVRQQFPEKADKIMPDFAINANSMYEERISNMVSPTSFAQYRPTTVPANAVYKIELWQDPEVLPARDRDRSPTGRLITICNKQLCYAGQNPFSDASHPFVSVRGGQFPSRFWGTTVIDQMAPLQRGINKAHSLVMEAQNLTAAPQVVAEKGHGVARQTNEPGAWIEYQKGFKEPHYLQPPTMSQWIVQNLDRLNDMIQEVAQVREVSRGGLPAANMTGVGISLLQEADNTPWGPIAAEFAIAEGRVAQKMINRAYQGYCEPRVFSSVDELDDTDVVEFFSHGELAPVKVECDITSVMPESQAARQARVETLMRMGVLHPVTHRSEILRLMEFGTIETLYLETDLDKRRATRENKTMRRGQPAQRRDYDDDEVHVKVHRDFQKTSEFDTLDPMIQQMIEQHVSEHLQAIAQLKMMMVQQAAPVDGGGAPPGEGGVPPTGAGPAGAPPPLMGM